MKKLFLFLSLLSFSAIGVFAQENTKAEVKIKLKDGKKPEVFIDGKKYDYSIIELLDQSKIKSMNVVKGEKALLEYNAPNGVILISTKEIALTGEVSEFKVRGKASKSDPIFIIDGIKSSKKELEKLDPKDIAKIDVLKGEKALIKYNSPNGVIVVTTKKKD